MPYPVIFSDPLAVGLLLLDKVLKIFETNKFIFHGEHFGWQSMFILRSELNVVAVSCQLTRGIALEKLKCTRKQFRQ